MHGQFYLVLLSKNTVTYLLTKQQHAHLKGTWYIRKKQNAGVQSDWDQSPLQNHCFI